MKMGLFRLTAFKAMLQVARDRPAKKRDIRKLVSDWSKTSEPIPEQLIGTDIFPGLVYILGDVKYMIMTSALPSDMCA